MRPPSNLVLLYCSISPVDGTPLQLSITFCLQRADSPENKHRVKSMWGELVYQTQINKRNFMLNIHLKYSLIFLQFKQSFRFYI